MKKDPVRAFRDKKDLVSPESIEVPDMLHEMGNKLHLISGRAERLRRKLAGNETAEKNLSIILSQSERAVHLLEGLRKRIDLNENLTKQEKKEK